MSSPALSLLLSGCLLVAGTVTAWAQQPAAGGPSIYTCVDPKGRRVTSDRPIAECLDRQQKELNSSGTVRRMIGPSLTATERAALEERERKAAEERQREADERRVQKALLTRYPNQAAHDAERANALKAAQDVIAAGQRRIAYLQEERKRLLQETEFYKDAAKWPAKLKRQVEESEQQIAAQSRFIDAQLEETRRINARFDEELTRLRMLWARAAAASTTTGAAPASAPVRP
jgi:hypothetical protein